MKQLYAPWREKYARKAQKENKDQPKVCVFCKHSAALDQDQENLVVKRLEHSFIMLNLFPYAIGHVLVVPYQHTNNLGLLTKEARHELIDATTQVTQKLQVVCSAEGFNIGMNIGGRVAGGSIPEHLHMHIIPRFLGDTNFLATIAHTKVLELSLTEIYQQLKNIL